MPPSTLLAIAVAVAPAPVEPEKTDPADASAEGEEPEAEPDTAEAVELEAAEPEQAPDPFEAQPQPEPETIPGFPPDVRLDDESTWAELTVEQKDQLRAIRASRAAAEAEGRPPPPVYVEPETPPGFESAAMARTSASLGRSRRRRGSEALDWYEERDRALVRTTVGFGVTWGVSLILSSIFLGLSENTIDECAQAPADDVFGSQDSAACDTGKFKRLLIPGAILGVVGGLSGIGTLISGGFLGGHRGSRPYISVSGGRRQTSASLGARF